MASILLVEDDRALRLALRRVLERSGHSVAEADTVAQARPHFALGTLDVAICDVGLPDGSGLALLDLCRRVADPPTVIVMTEQEDLMLTITAIHRGASDCLFKPIDPNDLELAVAHALEVRIAAHGHRRQSRSGDALESVGLVGRTPVMRAVAKRVAHAAATDEAVLITGESGTGKEVVARTIHGASARASRPFVALNCAALSASLVEAELFGSSKGAFTGAHADRQGRIEAAADGTLFLDEIGELTLDLQPKLLRVLQERMFERVGETQSRRFDARVIAATNRDLLSEVQAGRFRADLYYRLEVLRIPMPPLRERMSDIDLLATRLLATIAGPGRPVHHLEPEAVRRLRAHAWPGNVRELGNVLRRAVAMAPHGLITPAVIDGAIERPMPLDPRSEPAEPDPIEPLLAVERRHIARALAAYGWNKRAVCRALGISRPTLDRKVREFGLRRPGADDADDAEASGTRSTEPGVDDSGVNDDADVSPRRPPRPH